MICLLWEGRGIKLELAGSRSGKDLPPGNPIVSLPLHLTRPRGVLLRDPRRFWGTGEVHFCTDGSKHISTKFLDNQKPRQDKANDLPGFDVLGTRHQAATLQQNQVVRIFFSFPSFVLFF